MSFSKKILERVSNNLPEFEGKLKLVFVETRSEIEEVLGMDLDSFFEEKDIQGRFSKVFSKAMLYASVGNKHLIEELCSTLPLSDKLKKHIANGLIVLSDKFYASYPQLAFSAMTGYDLYLKRDLKLWQRLLDGSSFVSGVMTYILILFSLGKISLGMYTFSWLTYFVSRGELILTYLKGKFEEGIESISIDEGMEYYGDIKMTG